MARSLDQLDTADRRFLTDRHLATLSTLRADGTLHAVAIAFTVDFERGVVRIITSDDTQKVRNVERVGRAAVCQVDGASWLTLEGPATVSRERHRIDDAVGAHERRYRPVSRNPVRVVIEILVDRVLGAVRESS